MKLICIATLLLATLLVQAEPLDNLTMKEAQQVVKALKENPYIFNYCDCCDHEGKYASTVELIEVLETEIVTCSWNGDYYSVKLKSRTLTGVTYTGEGPDIDALYTPKQSISTQTFSSNYHWTYDDFTGKAVPFYHLIFFSHAGNDKLSCKEYFDYPSPKQLKSVAKDKAYKKWYKSIFG